MTTDEHIHAYTMLTGERVAFLDNDADDERVAIIGRPHGTVVRIEGAYHALDGVRYSHIDIDRELLARLLAALDEGHE